MDRFENEHGVTSIINGSLIVYCDKEDVDLIPNTRATFQGAMWNGIVEEQEYFQSLGYPSDIALTRAFNHKLDKFDDLRLHMFMYYIWRKDMYDICHKVCDKYFHVDALWYPVGELNKTTMLDYTIVPFYNYDEFYPVM